MVKSTLSWRHSKLAMPLWGSGQHSGSPFDEPLYWNAGRDYGREALGRLMRLGVFQGLLIMPKYQGFKGIPWGTLWKLNVRYIAASNLSLAEAMILLFGPALLNQVELEIGATCQWHLEFLYFSAAWKYANRKYFIVLYSVNIWYW